MKKSISNPLQWAAALAIICLCLLVASPLQAQRLPSSVVPQSYTLTLTPDIKAATFAGSETIDVTVQEPTNTVVLNAIEIAFQSVKISANGKEQTATVTLDSTKEQATFTFADKIPAGKAKLAIEYTGILNNELRGFYLSKTNRRNYAVTQFESTDARRAYPCFDEPAMKATYDVRLVIDEKDSAISNGPMISDTPGPVAGKHTVQFLPTPKMSTYLVAFLVGDFQCTSGEADGVAIRTCATPDKVALTPYGLEVAKRVLHYYNGYFGIRYPLKKLDLVAIPDFEAGAMENFGAITYRETDLLIDEKTASVAAKNRVAMVVAHEMAHQWFGDLVTMKWWDNLWLNEGFASWMEAKAMVELYPEWKPEQTIVADTNRTLNLDALPTTRTIRAKADTPDEINQMFDGIAYGKASAVLQSVENYLGAETFRKGVHNYLAAHLYGNATAEDFWGAQTANSHKPVDKIMESRVSQAGVPLLTFGTPANGKVSVSQKRIFVSPSIHSDRDEKWTLPVCFKAGKGQNCQVLTPADSTLTVPTGGIFFANAGGNGYYRTAYPAAEYKNLVANVETSLTPAERISLVGDEWAQVRANQATAGDYLNLVSAVKADPNVEVLKTALLNVSSVFNRIAATEDERAQLSAWIRATFMPVYAKLPPPSGNPSEADSSARELRASLFSTLGNYGKEPTVLAEARKIAQQYLADPASVDATLGQTALSIAARNGDAAFFDQLQKIYETATNPEIQIGALHRLAQFEDPALAERSLNYTISDKVRNQDASGQITMAMANPATRELAWKFIQSHWDKVIAQMTTATGAHLVGSTGNFCTAGARDEVNAFFAMHKVPSSDRSLRTAIEEINGCAELRSLQEPNLKTWLADLKK